MQKTIDSKAHWESVYQNHPKNDYSWYQEVPEMSLQLIAATGLPYESSIIDVGGGDSRLIDHLFAVGYQEVDVLDISARALENTRKRLSNWSLTSNLIEADITAFTTTKAYDLWHDRAVFHFLTDTDLKQSYKQVLSRALRKGGHLVLASFALDGPAKCSGLPIVRYDTDALSRELGNDFKLQDVRAEKHITPSGVEQLFNYFRFVYE